MHKSTRWRGLSGIFEVDSADSASADADAKSISATTRIRNVGGGLLLLLFGDADPLPALFWFRFGRGMCGNCKLDNCFHNSCSAAAAAAAASFFLTRRFDFRAPVELLRVASTLSSVNSPSLAVWEDGMMAVENIKYLESTLLLLFVFS